MSDTDKATVSLTWRQWNDIISVYCVGMLALKESDEHHGANGEAELKALRAELRKKNGES